MSKQHHRNLPPGWTLEESYDALAEAIDEMSGTCTDECNSYIHAADCKTFDMRFLMMQQQKRIAELEAERDRLLERIKQLKAENLELQEALHQSSRAALEGKG